ncbi:hypothetical protein E1264_23610 [Actinomadura sp. KC216]|uniref:hypothetical protein n=1 Tax=Actinomadura sp. KC216 TaxID=2530370 RepID=UPI001049005D|nr:hypothetical protein [Actinomadura sp. KC216]TDB84744.1 hypothetical protein E1264_23610 [Actinomadura sp. KC216]
MESLIDRFGGGYGLSVSLTAHRPNDFVRHSGEKTEPISGFDAAKFGDGISIATGPDKGVITIDPANQIKSPVREAAQAVVETCDRRHSTGGPGVLRRTRTSTATTGSPSTGELGHRSLAVEYRRPS